MSKVAAAILFFNIGGTWTITYDAKENIKSIELLEVSGDVSNSKVPGHEFPVATYTKPGADTHISGDCNEVVSTQIAGKKIKITLLHDHCGRNPILSDRHDTLYGYFYPLLGNRTFHIEYNDGKTADFTLDMRKFTEREIIPEIKHRRETVEFFGQKAIRLDDQDSYYSCNDILLHPGRRYKITFDYVILEGTDKEASIDFKFDMSCPGYAEYRFYEPLNRQLLKPGGSWQKFKKVITVPQDKASLYLVAKLGYAGTVGEMYITNIKVEQIKGANP